MVSTLKNLPGSTFEITVTLSWDEVKTAYDKIVEELVSQIELPGFRKGKAPREMARKHVSNSRVYEEVLKDIVPGIYADTIKKHDLSPVISPKIEVLEAQEGKEWKLKILTCGKPQVTLGNYTDAVAKLKALKKAKIWLPGEQKTDSKDTEPNLDELLGVLTQEIQVELSSLMVEEEVHRLLSNLIEQTQKLGITVDEYLKSQNKTVETLRQEYRKRAESALKLEFGLEVIADKEKIVVEDKDIDEVIQKAKTDKERVELENQRYFIGSLLRRQKTLTHLLKPSVIKA